LRQVLRRLHKCLPGYLRPTYCYRPTSLVCRLVCHSREPCKNRRTDRDALWVVGSAGLNDRTGGADPPWEFGMGNFEGEGTAHCKVQGMPSMFGVDAAFRQITLTTCSYRKPSKVQNCAMRKKREISNLAEAQSA